LRVCGVAIDGPHAMHRRRTDGETAHWDLAYVGAGEPGALHPFIIADRAGSAPRAAPSLATTGTELSGVACVIVGVADLEAVAAEFGRAYAVSARDGGECAALDARLARFDDPAVVLATPQAGTGWLQERLSLLGPSPCAFLLRSEALDRSRERLPLSEPEPWGDARLCWIDTEAMSPLRIGVIGD
jgi:hypothetical protein